MEDKNMASPRCGHEKRDVSVGFFARVIVGLLLLTLLGMAVSLWYQYSASMRRKAGETAPSPLAQALPQQPPEPRLQVNPSADLETIRNEERALLRRYEWIDRETGIVRIPIERAIELLAGRGLPVRNESKETAPPAGSKKTRP